jgi:hypothetical protein
MGRHAAYGGRRGCARSSQARLWPGIVPAMATVLAIALVLRSRMFCSATIGYHRDHALPLAGGAHEGDGRAIGNHCFSDRQVMGQRGQLAAALGGSFAAVPGTAFVSSFGSEPRNDSGKPCVSRQRRRRRLPRREDAHPRALISPPSSRHRCLSSFGDGDLRLRRAQCVCAGIRAMICSRICSEMAPRRSC